MPLQIDQVVQWLQRQSVNCAKGKPIQSIDPRACPVTGGSDHRIGSELCKACVWNLERIPCPTVLSNAKELLKILQYITVKVMRDYNITPGLLCWHVPKGPATATSVPICYTFARSPSVTGTKCWPSARARHRCTWPSSSTTPRW